MNNTKRLIWHIVIVDIHPGPRAHRLAHQEPAGVAAAPARAVAEHAKSHGGRNAGDRESTERHAVVGWGDEYSPVI